ncbi:AIPR family protein [Afifella sp. H1R]|uniref:AIPR family protein n=1 Tax=Afifella sp. H1R TaxID=2908841 RepID=UPI001F3C38E2|nr:AIPR family protein [Afifella sp. H1R]MCF1504003.1 AIPR family protein [Afifella sp. H1R]
MDEEALESFARELKAEVEESVNSGAGSIYEEEEFTRIILERLAEEGAVENPVPLWQAGQFGRMKYRITGYSIPEDEERLLLVTTVHTGEVPPRPLTSDEVVGACRQALRFYECSCKGLHEKIEPSNTDASDLARRVFDARDDMHVLRILLLSDGITGLRSFDTKKAADGTRIIVDLFGIERLHRILGEGLGRDDIAIDFGEELGLPLPALRASGTDADYEAYMAAVPGELLASIYEKYGTRLLELNVRAFLGVRGRKSVNAGLRGTIREAPGRFLAYNNGIVATVDDIEVTETAPGLLGIKSVRGLQIVNGGQTTASLHRARRNDRVSLEGISVPAKIIKVGGEHLDEMVSAISRSANSQNTVQPADFSANDSFHVAVEQLANNTWLPDGSGRWFYERARGSYGAAELRASFSAGNKRRFAKETPKARRFSKTDLARYLNAWSGAPHLVSFGTQKNFQYFMQAMKDERPAGFEPDAAWFKDFIAKAILYRSVQSLVRAAKYPAYQANIAAYLVALLAEHHGDQIDLSAIWNRQAISPELCEMIRDWAGEVDTALRRTAGSRMPSEWAKKEGCWTAIRQLEFRVSDPAPPEFVSIPAKVGGRQEAVG